MHGRTCWGCAGSFAMLLRQLSKSAGEAIHSCGSMRVGPLHYLHPFLSTTITHGFCTRSTPGPSTDGKIVMPKVALNNGCSIGGPVPGEDRVEDDKTDGAGVSSNHMQRRESGLREVGVKAEALQHAASDDDAKPSAGRLLLYLAEEGFKPTELDALQQKYPYVTKLDPRRGRLVVEFFRELGLSNNDVVKLVGKYPQSLSLSVNDRMRPLVDWLLQYVDRSKIGSFLTRFPNILGLSIDDNLQPTMEWLLQYVDRSKMGSLHTKYPQILGLSIEHNLQPTMEWLLQYVDRSKMGSMLKNFPNILSLHIDDNLQPTMEWLLQYVDRSKMGSMLKKFPNILGLRIDGNLQPTMEWLLQYVDRSKIGSMLTRFPQILSYGIDDNLQPTLDYLIDLGLKHENKHKVFLFSSLMGYSIRTIKAKFDVLRNIYGLPESFGREVLNKCPNRIERDVLANFNSYLAAGFTRDEIKSMVMKNYMALGFNVRNTTYQPKLQFYLEVAQYKIHDIAEYPELLMPRIETIKGRMHAIRQASEWHPTPQEFKRVLYMAPTRFEKYLKSKALG